MPDIANASGKAVLRTDRSWADLRPCCPGCPAWRRV